MREILAAAALLLVACGDNRPKTPHVTATVCRDREECELQAPLWDNSCEIPSAPSSCRGCCAEQRKRCVDCDGPFNFAMCNR